MNFYDLPQDICFSIYARKGKTTYPIWVYHSFSEDVLARVINEHQYNLTESSRQSEDNFGNENLPIETLRRVFILLNKMMTKHFIRLDSDEWLEDYR